MIASSDSGISRHYALPSPCPSTLPNLDGARTSRPGAEGSEYSTFQALWVNFSKMSKKRCYFDIFPIKINSVN